MAKSYIKGASYLLYYNTATYASPAWSIIKACGDVQADFDADDVEVPERGIGTGHLKGENNPHFDFTLFEDTGDANVVTLIAAIYSGVQVELAVTNGPIATTGTKILRMESKLSGALSAARGDVAQYDVVAYRHANSDYDMARSTAP